MGQQVVHILCNTFSLHSLCALLLKRRLAMFLCLYCHYFACITPEAYANKINFWPHSKYRHKQHCQQTPRQDTDYILPSLKPQQKQYCRSFNAWLCYALNIAHTCMQARSRERIPTCLRL
uniref:Uncharacterized protein n=1 Tax=Glossina austeni TaxID=7395 RepID=A0A1A9UZL7_GLOAU